LIATPASSICRAAMVYVVRCLRFVCASIVSLRLRRA
jgi:hypothetical protein